MIVDDDRFVRLTVKEILDLEGIDIVMAASADECLKEIEKGFRGVILMDIMMPDKDGWDAIREILDRNLYKGIIIVMLTAMDVPDQKMVGMEEYITDYITKPFEPEKLVSAVKEYFHLLDEQ
jgi:DNA-binding response OmpR family regulator